MREILFRGKRVDNGEWVKGFYVKASHHWNKRGIHEDWIVTSASQNGGWFTVNGRYAVIPETVGQYTGLKDKNGEMIFEGDIVESKPYMHYEYGIVACRNHAFRIVEFDGGMLTCPEAEPLLNADKIVEVVGNVFDAPELLKGGDSDA